MHRNATLPSKIPNRVAALPIALPLPIVAPAMEFFGDEEEYSMNPTLPSNHVNRETYSLM
jgi:hypothetical protein